MQDNGKRLNLKERLLGFTNNIQLDDFIVHYILCARSDQLELPEHQKSSKKCLLTGNQVTVFFNSWRWRFLFHIERMLVTSFA